MPSTTFRTLDEDEVEDFVRDELLSPQRKAPIVALSTDASTGEPWINPKELASRLAGRAKVVVVPTGDVTWTLSRRLPSRLDVYGGAARIWWPKLTERSRPEDHPLLFLYSRLDAPKAVQRILRTVGPEKHLERRADAVLQGTVESVADDLIVVSAEGVRGPVRFADYPLRVLASALRVGQTLPVRRDPEGTDAEPLFSVRGLLPSPWDRIAAEYRAGDVVHGRVVNVTSSGAFVEILPGAAGRVPKREIDWNFVDDPADFVHAGDAVVVQILEFAPEERRCTLSVKRGYTATPKPPIVLVPGGAPFVAESAQPERVSESSDGAVAALHEEMAEVKAEIASVTEDRARLVSRIRELNEQVAAARRDARSAEDRHDALLRRVAGDLDPASSERAFLAAVRVAYGRRFDEGDRKRSPLAEMRVGREFLGRVRSLDGLDMEKLVEVCAEVAAGIAHTLPARAVHQSSDAGGPARARARDGAVAWRCSLQDNTPSARRLHWWAVPSPEGRVVEFASVGLHDDYSVPE